MNALEKVQLDEALIYEGEEKEERFIIDNRSKANWGMRMLKALNKEIKEIEKTATEEIYNIELWKEKEMERVNNSIGFFEGLLTEYFMKQREEDSKFIFHSPYGRISTRKQQPMWNYLSEEETINWLKSNNRSEFVRVKESLDKTTFKKSFEVVNDKVIDVETGEVIPGISVVEREDKIVIKVEE